MEATHIHIAAVLLALGLAAAGALAAHIPRAKEAPATLSEAVIYDRAQRAAEETDRAAEIMRIRLTRIGMDRDGER
jgi:hypothetical protein